MGCEMWRTEVDAYVDAALPADRMAQMQEHLRTCAACAREALEATQLRRVVSISGRRYKPTAEFRGRVSAQLVPRRSRFRPNFGWALAFAAVLVAVLGIAYQQHVQSLLRRQLVADVVDRHVTTVASANMVDVPSSDRHTVKPWFQGKLPFSFNLPEVNGTQFTLLGGRTAFLNQSPGAELIYDVRQHHISVMVFSEQPGFGVLPVDAELQSAAMHVETWTHGGLRYFVTGDASAPDLKALADLIRRAAN